MVDSSETVKRMGTIDFTFKETESRSVITVGNMNKKIINCKVVRYVNRKIKTIFKKLVKSDF